MKVKETIRNLGRLSYNSKKEGYMGDASEYGFRQNVLELLQELIKETKENSKQQKYLRQTLEGLEEEMKEISKQQKYLWQTLEEKEVKI